MLRLSGHVISCPHSPTDLLHTQVVCTALTYRSIHEFASYKLGHITRTKVGCYAAYVFFFFFYSSNFFSSSSLSFSFFSSSSSSSQVWALSIHFTFLQDVCKKYTLQFLGFFAKLWKTSISFVMSVRPHGTTRLPLDRCSWNMIF